ncbi:FtsX-like permease family protein [Geomonas terrae]|uniref:FtsX-like permease family protein n=1 Tax=Geomonas terrae TaxID=2562681 RepID=A0A4S1CKW3_9BACT|nr:FtsX-like permease family protein [Geomonas terrae]TGU74203.1 FtsX-like permease family protein [Geomonas terrae]
MRYLLRHLSLSYARRHLAKTVLTLLGVVVGVTTFSSIRTAQDALVAGIGSTVDRVAGKAHLQVTMEGGVPEGVQEQLRNLPGVRATSPVIEQIVVPEKGELGSLMVIGVDLLGDREMRDYGFEGDDADLDDPLLFLAQPDSALFTREFAKRAGLTTGGTLAVRVPTGIRKVTARGLMSPKGFAQAFGGNLMVVDVYAAQELFGRGRRFDRIDVRLAEGVTVAQGTELLKKALGPAYRVETPARRGEQMERLVANFTAGFNVSSAFALSIGIFLIFNAFNVAVNRRRRDIGTLRALGATPRQVQLLFLVEALIIGLAGGAIGCVAGTAFSQALLVSMGQSTEMVYGISGSGIVHLTPAVVVHSMLLGLIASLAGAWGPALAASRISPTEAFAKGSFQAKVQRRATPRIVLGALLVAAAAGLALSRVVKGDGLVLPVLLLGGVGLVLLIGPVSRGILLALAPALGRLFPSAGPLSCDALLGNPRRSAGTIMAMALSLTFVLGLGGYMGSTRLTIERWMDDILTCDLFVRASANFSRPDFLYPGKLKDEILSLPGVRTVESYRAIRPQFRGRQILVGSVEMDTLTKRVRYEFAQGDLAGLRDGLINRGMCAVTENFYDRFGLGKGDTVELTTPGGVVRFPIAAVIRDYSSDQGAVFLDRKVFLKHWQDDRVDIYDVSVTPGTDPGKVRDTIRARLSGRYPALISTQREFKEEIGKAIDAFYAVMRITVFLALGVAFLGIVTSLLISVAERTREIGILKALGALPGQIARSVVLEALVLALVGLVVALPAGNLFASFMEGPVARAFTGWAMPHHYPWEVLGQLLVLLPLVSFLAAGIPARQAAAVKVTEAVGYE